VLLVDDDTEMRAVLRDFLTGSGWLVEEAADVKETLASVQRAHPAVIVLDHEMPGDWGLEVLPALRREWPHIPVIIVTAFGGPRLRGEALQLGAVAYLDKPFRLSELLALVRRVVAARPATPRPTGPPEDLNTTRVEMPEGQ
jgi:DNA-binding response OmpR family regulator